MQLKRLEIHGFKSFADRTVLSFQPGITAIVGPNGSGKSNIADSLRWVMGENNLRNIRGVRFEDIIFAGSETRKPLGMAEVTLVLDNTDGTLPLDFTEVAVARRVYRSGESEFLINRSPVRLKDIQELFFDTGLGKEAYSVISQGKIDAILSLRPEERRSVFEEAAGVMRYKVKKNLTMKKLAETENNILRIQDLLQELAGQLGPLAEQAAKAEEYLKLQTELRKLEINHFNAELTEIKLKLQQLEEEQTEKNKELSALKAEEESLTHQVHSVKARANHMEAEIGTKQQQLLEETTLRERALGELNLFAERKRALELRLQELEAMITQQTAKAGELEEKKETLVRLVAEVEREKDRLTLEVNQLKELIAATEEKIKTVRVELNAKKQLFTDKLDQVSLLKQKIGESNVQKDVRFEKVTEVREELEALHRELAEKAEQIKEGQRRLQELQQQLADVKEQEKALAEEVNKNQTYLVRQVENNQELRGRLHGLESKLTLLTEMERSHQGYFQGVKALLEAKKEPFRREIHGIVADLIKVEKGFELALDVAMGTSLQYLVITHDRDARQAIAYLKRNSLGRATFLPLNLIEEKTDRLLEVKNVLTKYNARPATEVVLYDQRYAAIINHLLRGTIIAPDLKTAVAITEQTGKRFRLVTVEGEVIAPGGAITGGNIERRQVGLLSRKGEISRLQQEKEDLLVFMNNGLAAEKKYEEAISRLTKEYEEQKTLRETLNLDLNSALKDLEVLLAQEQSIRDRREKLQQVLVKLEEESSRQNSVVDSLEEKLKQEEAELEYTTGEINALEEWETKMVEEREQNLRVLSELASQLAGVTKEWQGKKENLQGYANSLSELTAEIRKRQLELTQAQEEMEFLVEQKTQMESKVLTTTREQAAHEAEIQNLKTSWQEALSLLNQLEERLRDRQRKNGEIVSELHRLELQLNRLRMNEESISTNLSEAYGEDWALEAIADWQAPSHPRLEITRCKRKMKELEPVNLQAIEEYQALKERVDFLSQQITDLTEARESLEKVIRVIEQTIKKRFTETFYQVRKEFIKLFEELFEGGKADLELMDPDNPLDSGIEVFAQPPGKRLQNLSLLSGGERAMTAIALLFAILRIKPSPFCILDEIDATLDDANVKRFTELLKIFSEELQFVVITHRRRTMEVADALYGVTMEEKGISKMISLELKQAAG
ncbi:MAG: chromosome segregation protein SMC [Firmicutes bacterium]|nr:chromosome segregation protein SMC [Bacillota bacterium]